MIHPCDQRALAGAIHEGGDAVSDRLAERVQQDNWERGGIPENWQTTRTPPVQQDRCAVQLGWPYR